MEDREHIGPRSAKLRKLPGRGGGTSSVRHVYDMRVQSKIHASRMMAFVLYRRTEKKQVERK